MRPARFFMPALVAAASLLAPAGTDLSRAATTLAGDLKAFLAVEEDDHPAVGRPDEAPALRAAGPPMVAENGPRYTRAADGLFYVHARINGRRIRFVLDTGASVVVLTGRDAAMLGLSPPPGRYGAAMLTANGTSRMGWTNIAEVAIGTRVVRNVKAAVVAEGLPVSLLGQNMLSRLGPVTIDGEVLRLG